LNRVLVVRRDNIGDLVCTTPLIAALRRSYPKAWIGALVNSYNAAVLERNPDLDQIVVYTKLKHLDPGHSALGTLAARVRDLWRLRRRRLDCVVLAAPIHQPRMLALARALGPKRIVAFSEEKLRGVAGLHEVERIFALAPELGIEGPIPPLKVVPDPALAGKARNLLARPFNVAVQISTRRPAQQWPAERFVELVRRLDAAGMGSMLLWSPGPANHPRHPGDDDKAAEIAAHLAGVPSFAAYRAGPLAELIGALAACDALVSSDGGAMHLAAALQKPIVCFFGDVDPGQWRPWGTPHRVLRPDSRKAADISVDQALAALRELTQDP
jgi:ADP-heptose:LPS heptosyltransferase